MKTWAPPTLMTIPYILLVTPNLKFFGKKDTAFHQSDWSSCFKQLIDAGEEVYTINIQPNSDYLDIVALRAIGNQPTPTSALHSEPLPTDEAELFAKVVLRPTKTFSMCSHEKEAKNMPPHH